MTIEVNRRESVHYTDFTSSLGAGSARFRVKSNEGKSKLSMKVCLCQHHQTTSLKHSYDYKATINFHNVTLEEACELLVLHYKSFKVGINLLASMDPTNKIPSVTADLTYQPPSASSPATQVRSPEVPPPPDNHIDLTLQPIAFFIQYIKACKEKQTPILWDDFTFYQKHLKHLGDNVLSRLKEGSLLHLQIVADTLPYIVNNHLAKGENISTLKIMKKDLFNTFICCQIEREVAIVESKGEAAPEKEEYLHYAIEIAVAMENYAIKTTSPIEEQTWISEDDPLLKEDFNKYFSPQDKKSAMLRRAFPLITRDRQWGFLHSAFYSHLLTLKPEPEKRELIECLNNKDYNYRIT